MAAPPDLVDPSRSMRSLASEMSVSEGNVRKKMQLDIHYTSHASKGPYREIGKDRSA